jgi:hypothetical protein
VFLAWPLLFLQDQQHCEYSQIEVANTSSIAQDKWISEQTTKNNDVALLDQFLKELLS